VLVSLSALGLAQQQSATTQPKPATDATRPRTAPRPAAIPELQRPRDFDNATRGLIGKPDTLTIRNAQGQAVWDLEAYKAFISVDKPAHDTVNPSLWRNAQLNMQHGLFRVHERIVQVRGYDLSNISFIQGDTGWIVFDPLISPEKTAKEAYDLVTQHLGRRPVVAVSTAIRTPTTTAACAASWTRPKSKPERSRFSRRSISQSTPSAKTSSPDGNRCDGTTWLSQLDSATLF
jgi:alkyl sulfatase BDS1-like metallo-beta-lactamase superfamily hydrolase